jgi:hypothetical protein
MSVPRPQPSQKCGNERCEHPFAKHYTTYDGTHHGCDVREEERQITYPCTCKGFSIVIPWTVQQRSEQ